jgi:nitroreductase/NAD-dependent dihydropyrimidine dehydrogenase PreA subunit
MLDLKIDDALCIRCGLCGKDCIARIIAQVGDAVPVIAPEDEIKCVKCQHCLAVCPTGALSILGKNPADSIDLSTASLPDKEQISNLIKGRRSIRHYRDENVDPALISDLLATLANAPTGVNKMALTFSVIDDKETMNKLRTKVLSTLEKMAAENRIPEQYGYMLAAPAAYTNHGADIIFRGAPHALIISAPLDSPCPNQDTAAAVAFFDLLAQSAGLGTVWWGMLNMVTGLMPEIRADLGIPPRHPFCAMLFGKPAIKHSRTVQRDDGAVIRKITL